MKILDNYSDEVRVTSSSRNVYLSVADSCVRDGEMPSMASLSPLDALKVAKALRKHARKALA